MFGCGNYPTWPSILESVRQEAIYNLQRLRHHPSIVIYVGNNEDYQVQESVGLTYDFEDKDPDSWLKSDFPARYIYEKLLPEVTWEHCPGTFYHPGSPWGDGKISSDPTVGDMHQWNGMFACPDRQGFTKVFKCGMEPRRNTKSSTLWVAVSTANLAWRHSHTWKQLNPFLETRRTIILNLR